MGEIYNFKIHEADTIIGQRGLVVNLYYPHSPEPVLRRLDENLPFGVQVFKRLV